MARSIAVVVCTLWAFTSLAAATTEHDDVGASSTLAGRRLQLTLANCGSQGALCGEQSSSPFTLNPCCDRLYCLPEGRCEYELDSDREAADEAARVAAEAREGRKQEATLRVDAQTTAYEAGCGAVGIQCCDDDPACLGGEDGVECFNGLCQIPNEEACGGFGSRCCSVASGSTCITAPNKFYLSKNLRCNYEYGYDQGFCSEYIPVDPQQNFPQVA